MSSAWLYSGCLQSCPKLTSLKSPAQLFSSSPGWRPLHDQLRCLLSCLEITLFKLPEQLPAELTKTDDIVAKKGGIIPKFRTMCFVLINSVIFNFCVLGSCFGTLAIIHVSDFVVVVVPSWLHSDHQHSGLRSYPKTDVIHTTTMAVYRAAPKLTSFTRPPWLSIELSQADFTQITSTAVYRTAPLWRYSHGQHPSENRTTRVNSTSRRGVKLSIAAGQDGHKTTANHSHSQFPASL